VKFLVGPSTSNHELKRAVLQEMLMAKVVSDNFDEPGRSQHPDMVQESIIKWFSNWRYEQKPWGII
jgi:hypothetical protein